MLQMIFQLKNIYTSFFKNKDGEETQWSKADTKDMV